MMKQWTTIRILILAFLSLSIMASIVSIAYYGVRNNLIFGLIELLIALTFTILILYDKRRVAKLLIVLLSFFCLYLWYLSDQRDQNFNAGFFMESYAFFLGNRSPTRMVLASINLLIYLFQIIGYSGQLMKGNRDRKIPR
jgi:hypothetical protein